MAVIVETFKWGVFGVGAFDAPLFGWTAAAVGVLLLAGLVFSPVPRRGCSMPADCVNSLARRLLSPFGIEPITPLAFAAFRTAFGLGLLYVQVVYQPFRAKPFDVRNPHGPLADAEWINALAMNHTALSIFQIVACAAAVLFIAGILARLAYVVVVSMMFINVLMILTRTGGHDWGLPIVTLIVMTIVPWNEAPPLWQLRRSWAAYGAPHLASRVYGFAVWIPGLMVGLAFAAAAYAKVGGTGLEWITNGTVRTTSWKTDGTRRLRWDCGSRPTNASRSRCHWPRCSSRPPSSSSSLPATGEPGWRSASWARR